MGVVLFWLLLSCVVQLESRSFIDDPNNDHDGDGYTEAEGDCDDNQALANPGQEEVCDGIDNDCDEEVDGTYAVDAIPWYADIDADGHGQESAFVVACGQPEGYVATFGDCNDGEASVNPDAAEVCSGMDDDCDGLVDDADPDMTGDALWYFDQDGDGFGDTGQSVQVCERPSNDYVRDGDDCDDTNPLIFPGAGEYCDGLDNDCDGLVDDADEQAPLEPATWTVDDDGDGYGSAAPDAATLQQCEQPEGYALAAIDCNDDNAAVHPLATETCDGVDDDCDDVIDDGVQTTYFLDSDGDGYGFLNATILSCDSAPAGYVDNAEDCDDLNASNYPGAEEICTDGDADLDGFDDAVDNNCDGFVDEDAAVDAPVWYADADQDGFGDASRPSTSCEQPFGYLSNSDDCDDLRGGVNPNAQEDCTTTYDDDCNSSSNDIDAIGCQPFYEDVDGDFYGVSNTACICEADVVFGAIVDGDCNDNNAQIYPNRTESCATVEDDNCDGDVNSINADGCIYYFRDDDGDAYGNSLDYECRCDLTVDHTATVGDDCDDADLTINPGATEVCDGGADNDCDGRADDETAIDATDWFYDGDSDGFGTPSFYVLPDGRSTVITQCAQPVNFTDVQTDCDDGNASANPAQVESCSTPYDDDCDGETNFDLAPNDAFGCLTYFADVDDDLDGNPNDAACLCAPEGDYTAYTDDDCDDTRDDTYLGADEVCTDGDADGDGVDDAVDNDCDGVADEVDSVGCVNYHYDYDGDGHGSPDYQCLCGPEGYYVASAYDDCDDTDPLFNLSYGNCSYLGFVDNTEASLSVDFSNGEKYATNFDYNGDNLADFAMSQEAYDTQYSNGGIVLVWFAPFPPELRSTAPLNADLVIEGNALDLKLGSSMTAGDFDGDGRDELLVDLGSGSTYANQDTYLFDYENTGSGLVTEAAATSVLSRYSAYRSSCYNAIGDVNGDGFEDVEFSQNCNGSPEILLSGPDVANTNFSSTGLSLGSYMGNNSYFGYPFSQGNYEFWDFNGDGIHDNLYSGFSDSAKVHYGDVNFDDIVDVDSPDCGSYSANLRDFNGDGYGDLAIGDSSWVYTYDDPFSGPQSFTTAGRVVVMFGNEPTPASCDDMPVKFHGATAGPGISKPKGVGDLNVDGKSDLVVGYHLDYGHPGAYCMALWYGRDGGTFVNTEADAAFDSNSGFAWPRACGIKKYANFLGDVTGDGFDDVLIWQGNNSDAYIFAGQMSGN